MKKVKTLEFAKIAKFCIDFVKKDLKIVFSTFNRSNFADFAFERSNENPAQAYCNVLLKVYDSILLVFHCCHIILNPLPL